VIMGKILEALSKNEKSTASELAKLCGVEPKDVIAVLVRLERDKRVRQCNGYWYTGTAPAKPKRARRGGTISKVSTTDLVSLVERHGPITARSLAEMINASPKAVSTSLCNAFAAGQLSRSGQRSCYVYSQKINPVGCL